MKVKRCFIQSKKGVEVREGATKEHHARPRCSSEWSNGQWTETNVQVQMRSSSQKFESDSDNTFANI